MYLLLFLIVLIAIPIFFMVRQRRSGSRAAPPLQGRLKGPGTYEFDIVGESKYQDALEAICGGRTEESAEQYTEAELYLEDSNQFDNQAVRVTIAGNTVGYLSRENARAYRTQLKQLGQPRLA